MKPFYNGEMIRMSLVLADSNIGKVIQLNGLIEQMNELEADFKLYEGEMHYSKCWKALQRILVGYIEEDK